MSWSRGQALTTRHPSKSGEPIGIGPPVEAVGVLTDELPLVSGTA